MCENANAQLEYSGLANSSFMNKQATICAALFLYFLYIVCVGFKYLWVIRSNRSTEQKDKNLFDGRVAKFNTFCNDVIYRGAFFLFLTLLMQIQVGTVFGAVITWIYLISEPLVLIGTLRENFKIKLAGFAFQTLILIIMFFYILINPWCRYYYYRYDYGSDSFSILPNVTNPIVNPPISNGTTINTNNTAENNGTGLLL